MDSGGMPKRFNAHFRQLPITRFSHSCNRQQVELIAAGLQTNVHDECREDNDGRSVSLLRFGSRVQADGSPAGRQIPLQQVRTVGNSGRQRFQVLLPEVLRAKCNRPPSMRLVRRDSNFCENSADKP
jgi:glutamine synthetase adenylyltransferase